MVASQILSCTLFLATLNLSEGLTRKGINAKEVIIIDAGGESILIPFEPFQ